jgi:hypothetical protein
MALRDLLTEWQPIVLSRGYGGRTIGPVWIEDHHSVHDVGDEATATATLEIIECGTVSRGLEGVAVDRVVEALDVDAAPPAGQPERADEVGPVGVAETGRAVVGVRHAPLDAF